jgi:hypothetical protein
VTSFRISEEAAAVAPLAVSAQLTSSVASPAVAEGEKTCSSEISARSVWLSTTVSRSWSVVRRLKASVRKRA